MTHVMTCEADFYIPDDRTVEALLALRALMALDVLSQSKGGLAHDDLRDRVLTAETLDEAFPRDWSIGVDGAGGIVHVRVVSKYRGEVVRDRDFFEALGPFVEAGSYIDFTLGNDWDGPSYERYRWVYDADCMEIEAEEYWRD